jgi:hypothetical protein
MAYVPAPEASRSQAAYAAISAGWENTKNVVWVQKWSDMSTTGKVVRAVLYVITLGTLAAAHGIAYGVNQYSVRSAERAAEQARNAHLHEPMLSTADRASVSEVHDETPVAYVPPDRDAPLLHPTLDRPTVTATRKAAAQRRQEKAAAAQKQAEAERILAIPNLTERFTQAQATHDDALIAQVQTQLDAQTRDIMGQDIVTAHAAAQLQGRGDLVKVTEDSAATMIQKHFRGHLGRKAAAAAAEREKAATTTIQAFGRGYLVRKHLREQGAAATTIQTAIRGHLARKQLATLREQAAEREVAVRGAVTDLVDAVEDAELDARATQFAREHALRKAFGGWRGESDAASEMSSQASSQSDASASAETSEDEAEGPVVSESPVAKPVESTTWGQRHPTAKKFIVGTALVGGAVTFVVVAAHVACVTTPVALLAPVCESTAMAGYVLPATKAVVAGGGLATAYILDKGKWIATDRIPAGWNATKSGGKYFFTEMVPHGAQTVWSAAKGFFTGTVPYYARKAWDSVPSFTRSGAPFEQPTCSPLSIDRFSDMASTVGGHLSDAARTAGGHISEMASGVRSSLPSASDLAGTAMRHPVALGTAVGTGVAVAGGTVYAARHAGRKEQPATKAVAV